ncbi:unnamed protein product [Agarophyton chilense]
MEDQPEDLGIRNNTSSDDGGDQDSGDDLPDLTSEDVVSVISEDEGSLDYIDDLPDLISESDYVSDE